MTTVSDPFAELGVAADADDAAIRANYLSLIKQYTPEKHPERFARIRAAYEKIRDRERRVNYRLFHRGEDESIDEIIKELECRTPRPRISLEDLVSAARKA